MLKKPIIIGDDKSPWTLGISGSPHTGFEALFNTDIFNVDGVLRPNFKLFQQSDTSVSTTFTARCCPNTHFGSNLFPFDKSTITGL